MSDSHNANWERLRSYVEQAIEKYRVPGAAVGILHNGEIAAAGFGITNVDHPLPVTDETLFQIGSITKTFTATAIMRLVEMGKLELDATVRTYLPDFKVADETASSKVTIRHLLTHTGGWEGDFFMDTGAGDDALHKYMLAMTDLKQLAPVGTVWSYNNSGFCLLGYVIEKVTGKSYQAALKELILDPLGLKNCFFDPGDVMTYRFTVGHKIHDKVPHVSRPWPLPRALYPAGGITCHVKDLLRYARFHMGDGATEGGTRLFKPETMALMQTPQVTIWGEKETMGLIWRLKEVNGARTLEHRGGTDAYLAWLLFVPHHHFAIAIFTNAKTVLTRDVGLWALKQYLGTEIHEPTPLESTEEDLKPYVGRYVRPVASVELTLLGGRLVCQIVYNSNFPAKDSPSDPSPPPSMTPALCEKDRFLVLDGEYKGDTIDIIRKPDGSIGWLRLSRRIHVRED